MSQHQGKSIDTIRNLISALCPNGVEHRLLGELEDNGLLTLGRGNVISKKDLAADPGDYPVYSSSAAGSGEFGRYGKYMFEDERLSWSVDGGGRFFYRPAHKYSLTNVSGWLKVNDDSQLDTRYLFYALDAAWLTKTFDYTKKAHPSVIRSEYRIAVPPIEIQREIADILDSFRELDEQLQIELDARTKQYEYYRDQLLDPEYSKEAQRFPLSKLFDVKNGYTPSKAKPEYWHGGTVPWFRMEDIRTNGRILSDATQHVTQQAVKKGVLYPENSIMMSTTATIGEHALVTVPFLANQQITIFSRLPEAEDLVDIKYFFYYCFKLGEWCRSNANSSSLSIVSTKKLKDYVITLPPLPLQQAIVKKLDMFDELVNNVSYGLPAELHARRKQYQYYRNELLDMQELDV